VFTLVGCTVPFFDIVYARLDAAAVRCNASHKITKQAKSLVAQGSEIVAARDSRLTESQKSGNPPSHPQQPPASGGR
jgi:hypothetical protein